MPNPGGKNSPSSFDDFAPSAPYGMKKQQAALQKSAPVAGDGNVAIGTAQRATEIALKSAEEKTKARAAAAQAPTGQALAAQIPQEVHQQAAPDPYAAVWAEVAATPGASDLVRQYASSP